MSEIFIQLDYKDVAFNSNKRIGSIYSDSVQLGGVNWTAEMLLSRQLHVANAFTNIWYHYKISLACRLPENTAHFACVADIGYNVDLVTDGNFRTKPYTDKFFRRYSHDKLNCQVQCVCIDYAFPNSSPPTEFNLRLSMKLMLLCTFPPIVRNVELMEGTWNDVDVVFNSVGAERKVVRANKGILSMVSPFFNSLFYGPYKENGSCTVELPDVEKDDFQILLQYLYPCSRIPISATTVEPLLLLADRFVIETVRNDCEIFLILTKDDQIDGEYKRDLSEQYRLSTLKELLNIDNNE